MPEVTSPTDRTIDPSDHPKMGTGIEWVDELPELMFEYQMNQANLLNTQRPWIQSLYVGMPFVRC
jgi:hypothetical protein